jgi:hypothetical protein
MYAREGGTRPLSCLGEPSFRALLRLKPMLPRALASFTALLLCAVVGHAAPTPAPTAVPVLADLDPGNDAVVAPPTPIDDCEAKLRAAGVEFTRAQLPVKPGNAQHPTCGVEQALVYRRGPAKIRYNGQPLVSCGVALGLARFEQALNEEGQRYLGQRVARIQHGGTYNCRQMTRFALASEHSYANAIDIKSVTLENGRELSVKRTFGKLDAEPTRPEARFWRAVAQRMYDEGAFSVVLTPFFDRLHWDHLHLDQARYRVDGSRPSH